MTYSTVSLINAIIWFFGTITYSCDYRTIHSIFYILLVVSIVMNVAMLLTNKHNEKREKISLIVYSALSSIYLLNILFF